MKRRTVAIVGLVAVVLAVVALVWWKTRPGPSTRKAAGPDPWAGEDTAALIAKKRASRGDAPVDARPAALAGSVRRAADGSPVAGAVVSVSSRTFGGSTFDTGDDGPAIEAITDAAGAWSVATVRPGAYVVSAAAAELLPASLDVDVAAGARRDGLALVLEAGGSAVSGTVDDIGGGAIADARVTVRPSGMAALRAGSATYVAITGADGHYRLSLPDGSWQATASQAEYTADQQSFELRGRPLTVDFTLTPGGTIHGRVVARDSGQPVAGVRVTAGGGHGGRRGDDDGLDGGGATSDAAGAFTLRGVAPGALSLTARGRGYGTREPTLVDVGIGEEVSDVKVMVERAYTISGFVVRKGTDGEGVAGVRVGTFSFSDGRGEGSGFALSPSAADGYFEILGVQPGRYLIAAFGEGVMPEIGQSVVVVDRDVTDVLVTMDAGATLSGRVTPAAVAHLSLRMDMSKIGIGNMFDVAKAAMATASSDATGVFTMKSVPPGTFTLVAQAADGRAGTLPVTVTAADQRDLVVKLEDRGAISGRVVDVTGAAVAGVTVEASGTSMMSFELEHGPRETVTATDGSYRVAGLEPGDVLLKVSDNDGPLAFADADARASMVTIKGTEEIKDVILKIEARDGVIRGVVLGPDRQPAADAWVTARPTTSPWKAELQRHRGPRGSGSGSSADGDDDSNSAGASGSGSVGGSGSAGGSGSGSSETHVTVRVETGDSGSHSDNSGDDDSDDGWQPPGGGTTVLASDGHFTISHLRRGAYQVIAEATKGGLRAQKSSVQTGDTITLVLEPLGTLTVTVTSSGAPVAAYDVNCHGPVASVHRQVAAADGTVVLDRLAAGHYRCDASADAGSGAASTDLSGAGRLSIALTGWASVTGTVVDEQGHPRAGLRVVATGDGQDMASGMTEIIAGGGITTDATGRFTVPRLTAGKGHLMIFEASSFMPVVTKDLTLTAGTTLDLGFLTASTPPTGDP